MDGTEVKSRQGGRLCHRSDLNLTVLPKLIYRSTHPYYTTMNEARSNRPGFCFGDKMNARDRRWVRWVTHLTKTGRIRWKRRQYGGWETAHKGRYISLFQMQSGPFRGPILQVIGPHGPETKNAYGDRVQSLVDVVLRSEQRAPWGRVRRWLSGRDKRRAR